MNDLFYCSPDRIPSIPTLEETQAIVQEVHEDLQQLKPNAILETIRSWVLRDFYHSAIAFSLSLPLLLSLATELHFISAGF